jgi:hypothetical protein
MIENILEKLEIYQTGTLVRELGESAEAQKLKGTKSSI